MKFNIVQFKKETARIRKSAGLLARARGVAQEAFQEAKDEMINSFAEHPVTQEIADGPNAANTSNTLDGKGNLFSFIGFDEGEDPTEVVAEALDEFTVIDNLPEITERADAIIYKFRVRFPSMSELESITPMPWENGRSWIKAIESGISGFSSYIYWIVSESSRSGTGLQVKHSLREGRYTPVSYMSKILNEFKRKVK